MRAALVVSLLLFGCEPPFIDPCQQECDRFTGAPPKSGGCDNRWRRDWTRASKNDSAPDGSCDAQEQALDACGPRGTCDDHS